MTSTSERVRVRLSLPAPAVAYLDSLYAATRGEAIRLVLREGVPTLHYDSIRAAWEVETCTEVDVKLPSAVLATIDGRRFDVPRRKDIRPKRRDVVTAAIGAHTHQGRS